MAKRAVMTKQASSKRQPKVRRKKSIADKFSERTSFRLLRRRDVVRPLALPGYIAFTGQVLKTIGRHKKMFAMLLAVFSVTLIAAGRMVSAESYNALVDVVSSSQGTDGNPSALVPIEQAGILLSALVNGGGASDSGAQTVAVLLGLFLWLVVVWLLRQTLSGNTVRVRDGLYSAGAPIVGTLVLAVVLLIQLLPAAIAALLFSSAQATAFLQGGVETMAFAIAVGLLVLLSLYWAVATFFAAIIVTLPGTYPLQALRSAAQLVAGRRTSLVLRFLWLILVVGVIWLVVGLPVVLLDMWLKTALPEVAWLPLVPGFVIVLSVATGILSATYTYLLYRKVVDHDAATR